MAGALVLADSRRLHALCEVQGGPAGAYRQRCTRSISTDRFAVRNQQQGAWRCGHVAFQRSHGKLLVEVFVVVIALAAVRGKFSRAIGLGRGYPPPFRDATGTRCIFTAHPTARTSRIQASGARAAAWRGRRRGQSNAKGADARIATGTTSAPSKFSTDTQNAQQSREQQAQEEQKTGVRG